MLDGANGVATAGGGAATTGAAATGAGCTTAAGGAIGASAGAAAGGGGAAGAGLALGGGAPAATAAALTAGNMSVVDIPHTPQNAAPRSTSDAQRGHFVCAGGVAITGAGAAAAAACIAFPHIRQNRIPGGLSVPQREQRSKLPDDATGAEAAGGAGCAAAATTGAAAGGGAKGAWAGADAGAAAGCAGGGAPMSRSFWPQSRQNNADGGFWRPQLLQFIAARFHYQQGMRVKERA